MKIIADSCVVNNRILSQSKIYDFLIIAAKGIDEKREIVSDVTFKIYKDIMENYQNSNSSLKSNYPRLIIDIISILHKGIDTSGKKVALYNIERYYQTRKLKVVRDQQKNSNSMTTPNVINKELIENLSQITGRGKKELESSLAKLQSPDVKKLSDLCLNYSKLQKYSELVGSAEFGNMIERELGKKLTDRQLQHATISIRKVRIYTENMLDNKFMPHGSHGINHIKHNLEYGYQLMGLIQSKRRSLQQS
jgi:hypothetical protein